MNDSSLQKVKLKYLTAFFTLFFFVVGTEVVLQSYLSEQEFNSKVINISGRQRMLSQRLVKELLLIKKKEDNSSIFKEIESVLDELNSAHKSLSYGNIEKGIRPPQNLEIKKAYEEINPALDKMKKGARCIIEFCAQSEQQKQIVLLESEKFLVKMNEIVLMNEKASVGELLNVSYLELLLSIVLILFLIIGFFKILIPINRKLLGKIHDYEESENFNKIAEKIASLGRWELDVKTGQTKWSDEIYRIHKLPIGTDTNKIIGISFYAEHERPRIEKAVVDCISLKKRFDSEFEFFDSEGNKKWVRSIGEPVVNNSGEVEKLVGVFQDVTAKKLAEKETLDSKTYLELAVEGANLGIWDWDLRDNSVHFDKRWAEMLGIDYNEIEMSLETWESRVHPEDLKNCYKDIKNYMDGEAREYENIHRMKHKDGHWVYILDRGKFSDWDKDGKPIRFTGTHFDITETKKIQEEQQFILASTNVGVWKWDIVNNILDWDDSMYNLYEVNKDDFNGAYEAWEKTLHPDDQEKAVKDLNRALEGKGTFEANFSVLNAKGEKKHIGARGKIDRDRDGRPINMSGINWDRTSEHEAEQELEKQKHLTQHNAKLASIGELAAGVGHEINNPLTIIKGYIQILLKRSSKLGTLDYKSIKELSFKMDDAVTRISNIVVGLRAFSRQDTDVIEKLDVISVINESMNLIREIYKNEGVELSYTAIGDTQLGIKGNRGKIQQVLMNLLSNAKDATLNLEKRKILITSKVRGDKFVLKIEDNGSGMKEDVQKRIFDPFFTTKEIGKGTGIGLALVHSIVHDHEGKILVDSAEGRGTTFCLEFPAIEFKEATKEGDEGKDDHLNLGINAILVDDEEEICNLMEDILKGFGIEVKSFFNGEEALKEYISNPTKYSLIVSDMKMPVMSGTDLLKSVREQKDLSQPRFVFMTGGVGINLEDKNNEFNNLIDGHFYKPFEPKKISDLLKSLFESDKS